MDDAAIESASEPIPTEGTGLDGTSPPTPAPDAAPSAPSRRKKRKGKRARRRSRPVAVAPAEGAERARVAAAALADLDAEEPGTDAEGAADPGPSTDATEDAPEYPAERAAQDVAALATVAMQGIGVILRRRGYATAAATLYEGAEARAGMIGASLGERAAARFGGRLAVAGIVAALAVPFLADLWARAPEVSR